MKTLDGLSEVPGFTAEERRTKIGFCEQLKGGVIMDVTNAQQAKIAEDSPRPRSDPPGGSCRGGPASVSRANWPDVRIGWPPGSAGSWGNWRASRSGARR